MSDVFNREGMQREHLAKPGQLLGRGLPLQMTPESALSLSVQALCEITVLVFHDLTPAVTDEMDLGGPFFRTLFGQRSRSRTRRMIRFPEQVAHQQYPPLQRPGEARTSPCPWQPSMRVYFQQIFFT
jgi:hypothetical protein